MTLLLSLLAYLAVLWVLMAVNAWARPWIDLRDDDWTSEGEARW